MRDFIVDDDDEINNGFDYRKELHETLKTNFRFDKEKSVNIYFSISMKKICLFLRYRGRFLDDDEDDLRHMESSFDQIEKEEDFRYILQKFLQPILMHFFLASRRQGLREDLDDILREQADKQKRPAQIKKRPKTAA